MTNKEKCSLSVDKDFIPDAGLGKFIEGYTTERDILGKFSIKKQTVYIFQEGILWVTKYIFGKSEEIILRYDEMGGIRTSKERQYQSTYGLFKKYIGTNVILEICDKDGFSLLKRSFSYMNEKEDESMYNALGCSMVAIQNQWSDIAIRKLNHELSEKGYGTFRTIEYGSFKNKKVTIKIGRDFLKADDNYAGSNFKYAFQDGSLYIYPSEEDRNFSNKKEYFTININDMYDKEIFLQAAYQLLGIK